MFATASAELVPQVVATSATKSPESVENTSDPFMPLILTERDVRAVLPMADLIAAMEDALREFSAGRVVQPVRTVLEVGADHAFFGVMPAAIVVGRAGGRVLAELEGLAIGPAKAALRSAAIAAARPAAEAEGHFRIALLVDLAPVILGAFVLVRQDVIGAGDLGEALGRLGIVLVLVGVQLLGELAIGLLDLGLARAPRDVQLGIEIGHA